MTRRMMIMIMVSIFELLTIMACLYIWGKLIAIFFFGHKDGVEDVVDVCNKLLLAAYCTYVPLKRVSSSRYTPCFNRSILRWRNTKSKESVILRCSKTNTHWTEISLYRILTFTELRQNFSQTLNSFLGLMFIVKCQRCLLISCDSSCFWDLYSDFKFWYTAEKRWGLRLW